MEKKYYIGIIEKTFTQGLNQNSSILQVILNKKRVLFRVLFKFI
jgi:hypothetical protein